MEQKVIPYGVIFLVLLWSNSILFGLFFCMPSRVVWVAQVVWGLWVVCQSYYVYTIVVNKRSHVHF